MSNLLLLMFSFATNTPSWILWGALILILAVSVASGCLAVLLLKHEKQAETKSDAAAGDSL